jgi:hypothetical protein
MSTARRGWLGETSAALGSDAWELLRNSLLFSFGVVLLDLLIAGAPRRLFVDPLPLVTRDGYVHGLLTLFGLPSALLVTLTSLAIPTLSPYANPSLLLRYRRYPETTREKWWTRIAGRGNPFRWALQVALNVAASLFLLLVLGGLGIAKQSSPVLALITAAAFCEVALLLAFVFWVIGLRHPSAVVEQTLDIARNALLELRKGAKRVYVEIPRGRSRGPYKVRFREQELLKQITEALAQASLRALQDRQPFSAREGLEALAELFTESAGVRPVGDRWYAMVEVRQVPNPEIDWLRLLVLEGIHDVLVACASAHYLSVGQDALRVLERLSAVVLNENPTDSSSKELFGRILWTYVDAFDESLQFREYNLLTALMPQLQKHVARLRTAREASEATAEGWIEVLVSQLPGLLRSLGTPSVTLEDFGALRSLTDLMTKTADAVPEARDLVATAAINQGATALALRSDRAAALIAGWIAGVFDSSGATTAGQGEQLVRLGRLEAPRSELSTETTSLRADFVSVDYVEVFLALVAARGAQFDRGWLDASTDRLRIAVNALPQGAKRCEWVCERVGNVSRLAPVEIKGWVDEVTEFWASS